MENEGNNNDNVEPLNKKPKFESDDSKEDEIEFIRSQLLNQKRRLLLDEARSEIEKLNEAMEKVKHLEDFKQSSFREIEKIRNRCALLEAQNKFLLSLAEETEELAEMVSTFRKYNDVAEELAEPESSDH